jgi:hypothetical protein
MPMIQECGPGQAQVDGACVSVQNQSRCQPGFAVLTDGSCCPASQVGRDGRTCRAPTSVPMFPVVPVVPTVPNGPTTTCASGERPDARGNCPEPIRPVCPAGETLDSSGRCVGSLRPLPPTISSTPKGAPNARPEDVKRPQRDNGVQPTAPPQVGPRVVEPQIKRPPPPPHIQSRPPAQRPAARPTLQGKRCKETRC